MIIELPDIIAKIAPVDEAARAQAEDRQLQLTKPPGALGRVEALGNQLAAISGHCPPNLIKQAVVTLFAGDHGVYAQGVSSWPQEITGQMAANIAAGGAAISVLADQFHAEVIVTDVGMIAEAAPGVVNRKIAAGTADLSVGPAMTEPEALAALLVGYSTAAEAIEDGADCVITGEMGIANTTPSAALIAALLDLKATQVVGRGAGADDEMLQRKEAAVQRALDLHRVVFADPMATLAALGGFELAAIAGAVLAGAAYRVPVIVDGVISAASALVAVRLAPAVAGYLFAGHAGVEPGIAQVHKALGLEPLVDLNLRLGEGSGAILALPALQAAAAVLRNMATFEEAAVSGQSD